jgi:hypothetical protein
MTLFDHLRTRLLQRAGLTPVEKPIPGVSLAELARTEWSAEFERLMRNRLVMGALRYGRLSAPGKPQYDRIASVIKRLYEYQRSGNQEMLVDAANLCLCEFVEGQHPAKHFQSDESIEHVRRK